MSAILTMCVSCYCAGKPMGLSQFQCSYNLSVERPKHVELQSTQISVNEKEYVKRELVDFVIRLTRPVAPEQISRASRTTTSVTPLAMSSLAAKTPVIPEPMMMTEARVGRAVVVRWWTSGLG